MRQRFYQFHIFSLCLVAFFLPLKIHYCNIFIGVSLFFWLLSLTKSNFIQDKNTKTAFYIFISLYLIQIAGLLYTENLAWGFFLLETKLSLLVFPLMILFSPINQENIFSILRALIVGVTIACLWCHGVALIKLYEGSFPFYYLLTEDPFHNVFFTQTIPIHPAYLTFCVSIAFFYIIEVEIQKNKFRTLWIILLCYYSLCLFVLMSRAGLVAFGAALCIYVLFKIFYLEKRYKTGLGLVAVFCVLSVLFIFFVPDFRYRMIDSMQNLRGRVYDSELSSTSFHVKQWYCAWNSIHGKDWIWGLGTGDEDDTLVQCYTRNNWKDLADMKLDSHNEYLSSLMRHGLIGLMLFLLNLGYAAFLSIKNRNTLYLSFIIMVSINAMGASILFGQVSLVIYALFNALLAKGIFVSRTDVNKLA